MWSTNWVPSRVAAGSLPELRGRLYWGQDSLKLEVDQRTGFYSVPKIEIPPTPKSADGLQSCKFLQNPSALRMLITIPKWPPLSLVVIEIGICGIPKTIGFPGFPVQKWRKFGMIWGVSHFRNPSFVDDFPLPSVYRCSMFFPLSLDDLPFPNTNVSYSTTFPWFSP